MPSVHNARTAYPTRPRVRPATSPRVIGPLMMSAVIQANAGSWAERMTVMTLRTVSFFRTGAA